MNDIRAEIRPTELRVLSGKKVVLSQNDNVLVGCKLTVQM